MALLVRNQDDYVIHNLEEDGSSDEELGHGDEVEETFDPVCSLCDNGGVLLWYVTTLMLFYQGILNL